MNIYKVIIPETGEVLEMQAESKVKLALQIKANGIGAKIIDIEEIKEETMTTPQVHNKYANTAPPNAVYIGRPSKWGNPFQIGRDGTREEVIEKHKDWILGNPELLAQISELKGKDLVCYCSPQACHGDTLMELANNKSQSKKEDIQMLEGKFVIAGTGTRQLINEPQEYRHKVLNYMVDLLEKAKVKHGADNVVVISGMAEGFDEALARAAIIANVPFIAAVPNKGYVKYYWGSPKPFDKNGKSGSRTGKSRLKLGMELLSKAAEIVNVCDGIHGEDGRHANFIRNEWMADRASIVWVYNPNQDGGTQHCVNYCKKTGVRMFNIVVPKDDGGGNSDNATDPIEPNNGGATMPEEPMVPKENKVKKEVKFVGESKILDNGVVLNPEQAAAFTAITAGSGNVLLTGNAGTGKSFVTELCIKALKSNGQRVAICATTGIAATHIGGKTYHSALAIIPHLDFDEKVESVKKKLKKERYDVIIIDEISMMSKEQFEEMDLLFRIALNNKKPFGGKRMIFIGDFLQCEPVEKGVANNLKGFAFESDIWNKAGFATYQLKTVVRQRDSIFANFLNAIRRGIWVDSMMEIIESRMNLETPKEGVLRFMPTNNEADKINKIELDKLSGETFTYTAVDQLPPYARPDHWDRQFTTVPRVLNIKIGAQVLHLINDHDNGLVNGDVGIVTSADNYSVEVHWNRLNKYTVVVPNEFSQEAPGVYYRRQLPLRVAYAITIHKSQGMTLDKAVMSLSNTFTEGQMYVALSRVRSLEGLYVTSFDSNGVTASDKALNFYGLSGNLRGKEAAIAYAQIVGEDDEDENGGIANENPQPKAPQGGDAVKQQEEKKETKVKYNNCFVKLEKLQEQDVNHIVDILEQLAPDLESDVSNYAIGRKRLWLPFEAPLGNQPFKPGLLNAELWQWIVDACAKHGFKAEVALISKGGNINPHGDTTYAAPWAMGFNLGKCDWHIQTDRSATRTPAKPSQQDLDNFYQSPTTAHFNFSGGEVFKFDCKHEHAVTNAAPDRWSINVWGIADGPTAQRAGISDRLQNMLDNNPEVQEFILNHTPGLTNHKESKDKMTNVIDSFTGEYRWLSNFWGSPIQYARLLFPTMEHYYQAMKSKNSKDRERIAGLAKAGEAKQAGKKINIRDDWDEIKLDVMEYGLRIKFAPASSLATLLINTGSAELIEGNTWGDTFWGVCNGVGENNLGKILMKIREELNNGGNAENVENPNPNNDNEQEEDMKQEVDNCPEFKLYFGNTTAVAKWIKDMNYDNTYYMRKVHLAGETFATKNEWHTLGVKYIILDNKTMVCLERGGTTSDEYIIPDFVAEWFFQEPVNDWNIEEPKKKGKEMNIKEYLIQTRTLCEPGNQKLDDERIITRIITNDPDYWLNNSHTVVIKEVDRGNYYYAALNLMFGKESFAVNVTAFTDPFDNTRPQLTLSHMDNKPDDVLFGWADFDSEVMIRIYGKNPDKMSDLSEYGLVVKNSAKMTKRFAEIVRPSRGFKIYKKNYTLKKLVLSKADMLKAFPHLKTVQIAGVTNDGINIIATEVVKDAFRANPYMSPKDKHALLKAIEQREITNLTLRLLSGIGLFKGNTLHNDREIINARLRELGLGDGKTMYDIVTGEDNVKNELATDGSFELLTLEPHHGPGPVKTNDQTLGQYLGIEGILDAESILVNFGHVLNGMEDDLYQGKDISWMNNIHPEPAKSEAEKVANIVNSSVTSSIVQNIEILHSLDLDIGVSQMLMYMRAQAVIKMHLSKDSVKQKSYKPENRTFDNWQADSREKKAHLYMPHAFRAYVMTKEMLYLLGYDIDLHDKEAFYHEETQTFAVTGLAWASIAPKLGGADLDDEVMVHERKYIRPDGTVNPLVAFLLRTPNDWAEFAIVSMADHGPAFITEEDMPTINSADLAKFKKIGNIGVLPSKEPGSNQRPNPAVWDWTCVKYNEQCATVKGAGVGGQVKTKMLQYSTFNAPFADLVCANEDMIDALQQCKGTIEDLSAMNSWSDRAIMKILTEGKLDSYWWYSRNITKTISRLFNIYGFKSAKKPLHSSKSPIVTDLMIPREEMLWETYDRMVEFLNNNIQEIPELSVVFKQPVGNKPSDIEMRYRKLVYGLSKKFSVPRGTPEEEVGPLLNDACVEILNEFKQYIDKHGIEKAYVHILRMARASWLVKQDMPGVALDKWLYSNANGVQYTMLQYFRDAMVWFREREEDKKKN